MSLPLPPLDTADILRRILRAHGDVHTIHRDDGTHSLIVDVALQISADEVAALWPIIDGGGDGPEGLVRCYADGHLDAMKCQPVVIDGLAYHAAPR